MYRRCSGEQELIYLGILTSREEGAGSLPEPQPACTMGSISALRIRGDKHRRIQPDPQTPGQKLGGQHTNDKKTPQPEQLLLCETAGVFSSQEQNTPKCYSSLPQKYDVGGESNVTLEGLASESSALVPTGSTG